MTLAEFKAWFEGFTEGIESAPTAEQFAKIKAKVEKIDGAVTTYPIFVDRYRPYYDRIWYGSGSLTARGIGQNVGNVSYSSSLSASASAPGDFAAPNNYFDEAPPLTPEIFDAVLAFRDLGRREAQN